jgi:type II secretory pathway component PulF
MPVFAYQALNPESHIVKGTVAADTPQQARMELRSQGLQVERLTEHAERGAGIKLSLPGFGQRIRPASLASAIRELATLLSVGIPLMQALDVLLKQYGPPLHTSLLQLRDRVAAGASLAEAMKDQGNTYDELTQHMVEVGENAGNLDEVLSQLSDFKTRSLELKDRVFTALMYPMIVFSAAIVVSIFLMTVVVPMLLENLLEAGRPLPLPTKILKWMSDSLLDHGLLVLAVLLATGAVAFFATRSQPGRWFIDTASLKVPLFGQMTRKQALSRTSMILSTLLKSGIELVDAMRIAGNSVKNVVLKKGLEQTREAITSGVDLGPAMEQTGTFPPVVVQVFAVGQQTGHLQEMLARLAVDYDRDVATLSSRLAAAIEPILIIVLSIFVGFILFATILPILEAGNVL